MAQQEKSNTTKSRSSSVDILPRKRHIPIDNNKTILKKAKLSRRTKKKKRIAEENLDDDERFFKRIRTSSSQVIKRKDMFYSPVIFTQRNDKQEVLMKIPSTCNL
jgi:hypothetical protein